MVGNESMQTCLAYEIRKYVIMTRTCFIHAILPRRSPDKIHAQIWSVAGKAKVSSSCCVSFSPLIFMQDLSDIPQGYLCCENKCLLKYPVAGRRLEIGKARRRVNLYFVCASVKHPTSGNVMQPIIYFPVIMKPDQSRFYSRNRFSPGARVLRFLPLLREKTNYDCVIETPVLNRSLVYWK